MCRGAAPGSHLTTTRFALATLFLLLFFIRDVSNGTPQWCKKSALYSHFCPGVTGGGTRRLNHLKPSNLSFLHHVRGRDNTVQSPREKQQNQSRARSHSNTTAWKGKSLCNPLLPSQEKSLEGSRILGPLLCRKPAAEIRTIQGSRFPLFNLLSQTKTLWQKLGGHCRLPTLLRQPLHALSFKFIISLSFLEIQPD